MKDDMTESASSASGSVALSSTPSAVPNSHRRRSRASMILPPLIAFALGQIFIMLAASYNGFDPFQKETWFRSDSAHYFSIATSGYEMHPSTGPIETGIDSGPWQGNVGWMPLYPWMIRLLMALGASSAVATIGPVLLFHFLTLAILWNRFLCDVDRAREFCCLLLAAFFPSQVYQHAVFPISMLIFLCLLCFDRLLAGRWWAAGLAGLLAAISYATGFLLGLVLALFLLLSPGSRSNWPTILRRAALVGALPLLGLGLVCAVDQIAVGVWNAFFLVQSKYGHGLADPISTLYWQISVLLNAPPAMQIFRLNMLPQIIVISTMMIGTLIWAMARWRKLLPVDRLLVLFAAAFWIFPLVMGMGVMPLRAHACLLPMIPLARKLPAAVQVTLLVVFVALSVQTSKMFFYFTTL
jgi:hypothetical protein